MGQQPNIELEIADLPRPTPVRAPERRWSPKRPGDLGAPEEVPWGGMFGTTGPDTGYAFVLLRTHPVTPGPGENRADVNGALAAIIGARASLYGRAPTREDVHVAALLLGYDGAGIPESVLGPLAADRAGWIANLAHHPAKARSIVASIDRDVLRSSPDDIRSRMTAGHRLIGR